MKNLLTLYTLILSFLSIAQKNKIEVSGYAPDYIGKEISFYTIQDYFSYKDSLIGKTSVGIDSLFSISLPELATQKIIIKAHKNEGFIYIQPKGKYSLSIPDKDPYNAYRPHGNKIEIAFQKLDTNDINYKILIFDRWVNDFLSAYMNRKTTTTPEFASYLDTFRINVDKYYFADTSIFFKTYLRFSLAKLDDIQFVGARNRYDKYEFYLKNFPIMYSNEMYMNYFSMFYTNMIARFPSTKNEEIYNAIIRSSPSLLYRILSEELTLKNPKIRELAMIKTLSEAFLDKDYPRSNILNMLDSIQKRPLFKPNAIIAKNIYFRLTELAPGIKAPEFSLLVHQDTVALKNYLGKHVYLLFVDPSQEESKKHLELLKPMFEKYKNYIEFISFYDVETKRNKKEEQFLSTLPWKSFSLPSNDKIFSSYQIKYFPSYVLIDSENLILQSPALGPVPNGEYENIEKVFFSIKRKIDLEKMRLERNSMDNVFGDD
jgi:hypothetical protein